ncbi:MAG TPA: type VI secretion system baseplate subunit TssE, partial [Polyangiaceae bacterium]|nr:type VI secretion system baseplate subunit TssE [Polyangiaceae bacterium]
MAELTPKERLQPSLLDRLSDDEPDRTRESREKRVLSPQRLRESVRRDLSWLLNNTHLATVQDLDPYPHVEQSTLNYGMPDLAGKTASTVDNAALEKAIRRAIWEFEPRLLKESVRVKAVVNEKQMNHNALCFTIEAELWAQPLPLRLFLRTD